MTEKSLDKKLASIRAGSFTPADFIIADAKDADIGFGTAAPGWDRAKSGRLYTRAVYLERMRTMTRSGLVDVMLMSASTAERLSNEGLFEDSAVTPAIRLNDTTDIWSARGSRYKEEPARPHRTARVDQAREHVDLGLYSITFSNDAELDAATGAAYSAFRAEAAEHGMRHFLEVFNPAFDVHLTGAGDIGTFVNDNIVRTLAGVMSADYPLFLKQQYNGPRAMEELASYDPGHLIPGVLGGSRGTTRDSFELIAQAAKYGARVALYGRKINLAESPVELVTLMRAVVEGHIKPDEAVRAYHDGLAKNKLTPDRPFDEDFQITDPVLKG